jgi:DNA-binding NarL/FixJ family response regulator
MLADDHPMFRVGLRTLLESAKLEVVGEAATTTEALAITATFDVAVVDVVIPPAGGAALVRELQKRRPRSRILALSMLDEPVRVAEMLRAGASGYALKTQPIQEIVEAIRQVAGDVVYLAPGIAAEAVAALRATPLLPLERLTRREWAVFELLVRGSSNAGIAVALEIARSTVETHRRNIMHKLEAGSIVDLVRVAHRHGVIGTT